MFIQLNYELLFRTEEITYVGLVGSSGNACCWIEFNNGRTIEVHSETNAQAVYEKLIECLTMPQEADKISLNFGDCMFFYTGVRHPVTLEEECRSSYLDLSGL